MNTDMKQHLMLSYVSTVVRQMTAYQLCCAGLARSLFVLTEHISSPMKHIFFVSGAETVLRWMYVRPAGRRYV